MRKRQAQACRDKMLEALDSNEDAAAKHSLAELIAGFFVNVARIADALEKISK